MENKRIFTLLGLLIIASMLFAACGAPPTPEVIRETIVETVVIEREGEQVVITQIVEVERIVTPEPPPAVTFTNKDPNTFVQTTYGEPESLDPAWNYETSGNEIMMNVYETLVFYNRQDANEFIPLLATDWTLSDDDLTYVFTIRQGVKFHEGGDMTPEDVAWSIQRGILQGGGWSPQWLLTEPLLGIGIHDIAELVDGDFVDDPDSLQGADPALLLETCQKVTDAVVADNSAGTVTFNLANPWGPFLATIAQSWGSIQDKEWAVGLGAWDGDCATWQDYYGVNEENTPLRAVMNGTGPFIFDHWTPGEEIVLVRNPNYWRTADVGPMWEGGPVGNAAIERVVIKQVNEWGTRYAMLQAGDTDFTVVPPANTTQVDPMVGERCEYNADTMDFDCAPTSNPNGPYRLFIGHPGVSRTDAFFTFNINTEGGNNLIGSGQLDGNGIPPDFFSDIHVRRAFNYCFDWEAYIQEALVGEAVQNYGVIIPGMLGYNPNGSHYSFDLDKCQEEIEMAWDGRVAENGFRLQIAYNTGNVTRQTIAQILQDSFQQIDSKYQIEVLALPWATFLSNIRASRIPVFVSGWLEDIHDPHNWAQPFTTGTYAARQRMPAEMAAVFSEMVDRGVAETDPNEREAIYWEMSEYDYENAPAIRLAVATGRHYEQRWVNGWYYNPVYPGTYFYSLSEQ
jgi:peptide/nickel transport system substrate-binding protein